MTLSHSGSFDTAAAIDVMGQQAQLTLLSTVAGAVIPQNALTGAADVFIRNTNAAPGTWTTRTAAQLYADLLFQLGFAPPNGYQYCLRITNEGAGTLTLAAGVGVTLGTGTYTVATTLARDFIVTVTNAGAVTIQSTGSLSAF